MADLDLGWLIPTTLQVFGLTIGLAVVGFGYEHATRDKKPFADELTKGAMAGWLAVGGILFATGMVFTQTSWVYKAIAILLAGLLTGLAWTAPRAKRIERVKEPRHKPTLKSIGWLVARIYIGIFLMLILVWGFNIGLHAIRLYGLVRSVQTDPTQIQADKLILLVEKASGDVGSIYNQLNPLFPIFNAFQDAPWVGAYLGQVEPLISYANGLAQAGKELTSGLQPILEDAPTNQTLLSLPEKVSQIVQAGQMHFVNASQEIDRARLVRNRIRPDLMPASIRALFLKLDSKFGIIEAGTQALQVAPQLLGNNKPQSYLVLAQNRDELRATGGFISGIGLITVEDGKINQFNLGDSYLVDDFSKAYPAPPEPLKRFMLADYWVTRDANWSPDFPSAAQEAQSLYSLSTGVDTQGVIAFNQIAVQRILEVIGPVIVPVTDEPVTAANVEEYMRQAWAPAPEEGLSQEWWLHRKDFMQQLGSVVLEKVLQVSDREQLMNLAKTMVDLLNQGQVMVYFNDLTAQTALEAGGWDGGLHPGNNDYLYIVDSNVGFNKVDSVIQRTVSYQVDLSDLRQPAGEVTLHYQHTGSGELPCKQEISYGSGTYMDMQQRCYLNYWRVYVPGGTELQSSNAQPVPADELLSGRDWPGQVESIPGEAGSQVLAGLLMLPPAKSTQINISYILPSDVVEYSNANIWEYALTVQVQAGSEGMPFQLYIKMPDNTSVLNPEAGWKQMTDRTWTWQGILDQSTELKLAIQTNPKP